MHFRRTIATFLSCIAITVAAQENTDIESSHDHALITRMNNYLIGDFEENFNSVEMPVSEEDTRRIEGNKTFIYYYWNERGGAQFPSVFQIVKNHDNAIRKIGGRIVYNDGQGGITYHIKKNHSDVWVKLQAVNGGEEYYLTIVEADQMEQEITASSLFQTISDEGSVALYINFETGKSVLPEDANAVISEIAQMLIENPELKVSIEGHTDNSGNSAANKVLSQNRAKAVVQALTNRGVPSPRITSTGWGQEKPIGDNTTETGRALNRRVEIVKK